MVLGFKALVIALVLGLVYVVIGVVLSARADFACRDAGYPRGSVSPDYVAYCFGEYDAEMKEIRRRLHQRTPLSAVNNSDQ